jgi:hypothetical protein
MLSARFQARSIAGARDERRLLSVACKPLLGRVLNMIIVVGAYAVDGLIGSGGSRRVRSGEDIR